jgi:predicted DNA-binding antitoxin AbrB/MazE fold protein
MPPPRTADARIDEEESIMTVKAIYEDGVFKPMEKVALADKTEVELDFRLAETPEFEDEDDPRSFVGFIKTSPKGVPIARDHDKYIYKR